MLIQHDSGHVTNFVCNFKLAQTPLYIGIIYFASNSCIVIIPLSYNYIMTKKSLILTLFLVLIFKRADCLEDIIRQSGRILHILQPTIGLSHRKVGIQDSNEFLFKFSITLLYKSRMHKIISIIYINKMDE